MEVIDAGGTDLTYSIHQYLFPHIENSTEPSKLLKQKMDQGKLGFKSGEGFMKWSQEEIDRVAEGSHRGTDQSGAGPGSSVAAEKDPEKD